MEDRKILQFRNPEIYGSRIAAAAMGKRKRVGAAQPLPVVADGKCTFKVADGKCTFKVAPGQQRPPILEFPEIPSDDEPIGDIPDNFEFPPIDPISDGYNRSCTSMPFEPVYFRQDNELYHHIKALGDKIVASFNASRKSPVYFEDIASVTSCHSSCNHNILKIKTTDPFGRFSLLTVRGRVFETFAEAEAHHFMLLSFEPFADISRAAQDSVSAQYFLEHGKDKKLVLLSVQQMIDRWLDTIKPTRNLRIDKGITTQSRRVFTKGFVT